MKHCAARKFQEILSKVNFPDFSNSTSGNEDQCKKNAACVWFWEDCYQLRLMQNMSSNVNEVIGTVLNFLIFFYEKILQEQKAQKAQKA